MFFLILILIFEFFLKFFLSCVRSLVCHVVLSVPHDKVRTATSQCHYQMSLPLKTKFIIYINVILIFVIKNDLQN